MVLRPRRASPPLRLQDLLRTGGEPEAEYRTVASPHTSKSPDGSTPDHREIEWPTAADLGYPDSTLDVELPDWADGNVVQFGGPTGIELDRNAAIAVIDPRDWA